MSGLVVLDVDDTLLRTSAVAYRKTARTAELLGLPAPDWSSFVTGFGRRSFVDCLRLWFGELEPARFSAVYDRLAATIPYEPLPGLPGLVEALRSAGARPAILTNGPGAKTTLKLRACGLAEEDFVFVRHADNARHPKPRVEAFTDLVADHGVDPAETLYVSDCPDDGVGARAAGWSFVGVCSGTWCAADFAAAGGTDVLDDVLALPQWYRGRRA